VGFAETVLRQTSTTLDPYGGVRSVTDERASAQGLLPKMNLSFVEYDHMKLIDSPNVEYKELTAKEQEPDVAA